MIALAFTLSATGLARPADLKDPQFPRPVALAGMQWDDKAVTGEFFGLIRQEQVSVSAGAEKAHGTSDRMAKRYGLPERTAISWLTNSLKTSTHVLGWDLDFDLDVIRAALVRHEANPDSLIRPGLIKIGLQQICAPIVGKQDEAGAQVPPSLMDAITAITPASGIAPDSPMARAKACRVIFEALCARDLIPDMELAA